jgi:hypothetical protein
MLIENAHSNASTRIDKIFKKKYLFKTKQDILHLLPFKLDKSFAGNLA